jgi:hypothetical protein
MIKHGPARLISINGKRGAVLLLTVISLLIMVTIVTLYTGRILSFEHKIMLNTQNQNLAFAAAEAGLMRSLGVLSINKRWDGAALSEVLNGESRFTVSGARADIVRVSTTVTLISLSSTGTSKDGLASVTVSEQVLSYSILARTPDAPLIVNGGLDVSGKFIVVANPNGGGIGVPVSIWSREVVDLAAGSGITCGQQEFSDGHCESSPYSGKGFKDADIVDSAPGFPDDLMEYLFNIPQNAWAALRDEADQSLTDCSALGLNSLGLIWVDGNCTLDGGKTVGAAGEPVILVVSDGDFIMQGGTTINGIVFSFRKPGTATNFDLRMLDGARVNGVVVSNHPMGGSSGSYHAVYDAQLLAQINVHDAFQRIALVPGSWRDF